MLETLSFKDERAPVKQVQTALSTPRVARLPWRLASVQTMTVPNAKASKSELPYNDSKGKLRVLFSTVRLRTVEATTSADVMFEDEMTGGSEVTVKADVVAVMSAKTEAREIMLICC